MNPQTLSLSAMITISTAFPSILQLPINNNTISPPPFTNATTHLLREWPPLPFEDYLAWGYFIEITGCWPLHADEEYESQIIHHIAGLRARLDQGYDKEYLRYHDNSGPVVFDLHATSDIPTDTFMLWEVFKLLEDLTMRFGPATISGRTNDGAGQPPMAHFQLLLPLGVSKS